MGGGGGGGSGIYYSLKNLAHYSSHYNFALFIRIRPIMHLSKKGGKEI